MDCGKRKKTGKGVEARIYTPAQEAQCLCCARERERAREVAAKWKMKTKEKLLATLPISLSFI